MTEPSCFRAGSVHPIASTEKYAAIAELVRKAAPLAEIGDLERFQECVFARERLASTGLGRGVAVAHGKTPLVDRVIVSLGVSRTGIEFGCPDGTPVHLLFLVASPPGRDLEYLMTLATIASLCRGWELQQQLLAVPLEQADSIAVEAFERALRSRCAQPRAAVAVNGLH